MTELGERLAQAREAAGLTQDELALRVGMTQQGIAAIEKGKSDRPKKLREIARALSTTEDYLLGESEDEPAPPKPRTKGQSINFVPASELSAPGQKLNVYSGAQGGNGKLIISTDIVDRVEMPAKLRDVTGAYGILIDGESMVPEFWPGDTVWVNPHLRPARGRNHIFYHTPPGGEDAEAIIKRLLNWNDREWSLEQWNPHETFKEFRQEWPIAHRVVGKYEAE